MKHIFLYGFAAVFFLTCLALGYGFLRTWKTGRMSEFRLFREGSLPAQKPEGLWKGSAVELGEVSWKGKKFIDSSRGINLFEKSGIRSEAYPFAFFETSGIEGGKKVIRLDYNQKQNSLWLRFIVDEMVSVGDNEFLGIVYIKLLPGFPFRMGYFRLGKALVAEIPNAQLQRDLNKSEREQGIRSFKNTEDFMKSLRETDNI